MIDLTKDELSLILLVLDKLQVEGLENKARIFPVLLTLMEKIQAEIEKITKTN